MKKLLEGYLIRTLQQAAVAIAVEKYGITMTMEDVEHELFDLGLTPEISPCDVAAMVHYNLEQYGQMSPEVKDCFVRAGIAMHALLETPENVSVTLLTLATKKLPRKTYCRIEENVIIPLGGPSRIPAKRYLQAAQEMLEEFKEIEQEM